MNKKKLLWAVAGVFICGAVAAHEVKLEIHAAPAQVVTLRYANGDPFAFEAYELYAANNKTPTQVGRTNQHGQLIFLPQHNEQGNGEWRVKAYSPDGHGVDQRISVVTDGNGLVVNDNKQSRDRHQADSSGAGDLPRELMVLMGLCVVFGVFGVVQLFSRQ